jgi:hypothetical protein
MLDLMDLDSEKATIKASAVRMYIRPPTGRCTS